MLINVFIENENSLLSTIILWISMSLRQIWKLFSSSWFAYLIQVENFHIFHSDNQILLFSQIFTDFKRDFG